MRCTVALAEQRGVRGGTGRQGRVCDACQARAKLRGVRARQEARRCAGIHQDAPQEQNDRLLHLVFSGMSIHDTTVHLERLVLIGRGCPTVRLRSRLCLKSHYGSSFECDGNLLLTKSAIRLRTQYSTCACAGPVCVRALVCLATGHACHGSARQVQARAKDADLHGLLAEASRGFASDRHCCEGA